MTFSGSLSILDRLRLHLACGVGLLTRIPVGWLLPTTYKNSSAAWPLAQSIWCWPLIGMGIGVFTGGLSAVLQLSHIPPLAAAGIALGAQILVTGGLHEDGLADTADSSGGITSERKLEIMRDSRIGSYGVLALCLAILIRAGVLASIHSIALACLICGIADCLARGAFLIVTKTVPPARPDGLARSLYPLPQQNLAVALVGTLCLCTLLTVFLIPAFLAPAYFLIFIALPALLALTIALLIARYAKRKLGGYTGDILGGCAVLTECVIMTVLSAFFY
ncbi:adenosylcobinamide-GDP ribazoletransferase [Acetobacter ascendens]|uniref:Adenosylcobinamide-GDP ribazoletransferase n=1 Tax=Acetobacter ascendens TaxID=481146 RepID=A0A1D8QT28_9PROT|nr:adenosylcobinamide-GDP ribazoletransferase [Acetobacter ascendens]AOW45493.1 adenosylcobinamide-GDP ribazoletransferase [Acetobacter ascendens]AOW49035.1 adenosylcobinamide-GDP ribazoletransferase [Acetobacter ascendens]